MKTTLIVVFSSLSCLVLAVLVMKYYNALREQKDLIRKKKEELAQFKEELEQLNTR